MQLKLEILRLLEENRDSDLSGEKLAERFGVSRNAVWKAVNALKAEGYRINAGNVGGNIAGIGFFDH